MIDLKNISILLENVEEGQKYQGKLNFDCVIQLKKEKNLHLMKHFPESFFSKRMVIDLMEKYPETSEFFPLSIRNDKKIMKHFLAGNPSCYQFIGDDLKFDIKFFKSILKELNESNLLYYFNNPEVQYLLKKDSNAYTMFKEYPKYLAMIKRYIKDDEWDNVARKILNNNMYDQVLELDFKKIKNSNLCIKAVNMEITVFYRLTDEQKNIPKVLFSVLAYKSIQYYDDIEEEVLKRLESGIKNKSIEVTMKNMGDWERAIQKEIKVFEMLKYEQQNNANILLAALYNKNMEYYDHIEEEVLDRLKEGLKKDAFTIKEILEIAGERMSENLWNIFSENKGFVKLCTQANIDPTEYKEAFKEAYRHIELQALINNTHNETKEIGKKRKI